MIMTREEMMNNIIRKFGFEAKETINFCKKCEKYNYAIVKLEYIRLMRK